MISGLHSPVASSDSDSPQLRDARAVADDRGGAAGPASSVSEQRGHRVKGVASLKRREDALGLTESEKRKLDVLRRRDQEVRMHEQSHMSAAASLVRGPPKYTLTEGPDGRMYAIAGHVHLDTGPEPTAEATLKKAEKIKAAALAPGDPSPQDLHVAARASMMEMKARGELRMREMTNPEGATASPDGAAESGESASIALRGNFHARDPEHMANCPHCVAHAFVGRFKLVPGKILGVA